MGSALVFGRFSEEHVPYSDLSTSGAFTGTQPFMSQGASVIKASGEGHAFEVGQIRPRKLLSFLSAV